MAQFFTSDELIKNVKRRAMIPTSQSTFQNEDFLGFANDEMSMGLVPTILRHHEDYYLVTDRIPLESNKSEYTIPYRAIGNKLREISYEDNSGNVHEMTRIEIQDVPSYNGSYTGDVANAFYIRHNKIVIVPSITTNVRGSLLMSYFFRPNELVTEDRVAKITNINRATGDITVDSIPVDSSDNSLFSTTTKLDFITVKPPFPTLNFDITPSSINTTTNTISFTTTDIPDDLEVGDHINLACETIIPQIPADMHMQLSVRVAARCLEALGDTQGLSAANAKLAELENNAGSIIDNRVEGAPRKVVNRHGPLRDGLFRRRFRFRS